MIKDLLQVRVPVADLKEKPTNEAAVMTQILIGMKVEVLKNENNWVHVKAEVDGYEGYVQSDFLAVCGSETTHHIIVPRAFSYPAPNLRLPYRSALSMGSRLVIDDIVKENGSSYAISNFGEAIPTISLAPFSKYEEDYVSVAEKFLHTPYLWGGTSGFGLDCSGLVQLSMSMAGKKVARDSCVQHQTIGIPITQYELKRGDLVFWKGHVAIMVDLENILHANGYKMMVSKESLADAIGRISCFGGSMAEFRRPV